MTLSKRFGTALIAAAMGMAFVAPRPAAADGAASTRNIIFGAAAVGGTLLILNHNKKVHEKYAEKDRQIAADEYQRNQAQAAYESERSAYAHEAELVSDLKREVAYQHDVVREKNKQIASLTHSLQMAKAGAAGHSTAFVAPATVRPAAAPRGAVANAGSQQLVAYGWGTY
jgi:hypothetical protein